MLDQNYFVVPKRHVLTFLHPFWFSWATYWALEGAALQCSLFISLGLLLQGHFKQNLMNKYVRTLKYQLRKMDPSCYFFWKVFSFLMHLYLSMLAGKSLPEDSCIRTSIENRNFRWVNNKFQRLLAVWWLRIPYHHVHPSSASYIFSFHNCLPGQTR